MDIPNARPAPAGHQIGKQPTASRMNTELPVSTDLTYLTCQRIKQLLTHDHSVSRIDQHRLRNTLIDLAYLMESSDHLRNNPAARIITTLYQSMELPVLQPNIDAAHAYLFSIFGSGTPIFGVVSESGDKTDEAKQMEAIIYENSTKTGWPRQMSVYLKSALKYNVAAMEVEWKVRKGFNFKTDTTKSFTHATVDKSILRAGNELKAYDMYNTIYDQSVSPADVHSNGDFVAKFELLTVMQLHTLISDLQLNGGKVMNVHQGMWKSTPHRNWYHTPKLLTQDVIQGTDWVAFVGNPSNFTGTRFGTGYEVITYYRRIIPSMLDIKNVPDADSVQVWKFIEVNGYLIYAERTSNAHNLIPVIFVQPVEDNLRHQSKGPGQTLLPFQNLSSALHRARLASAARAISDRGLYDPSRIMEKHINSVLPTAKIPVKPGAYGKGLQDAYQAMPFDDRNSQYIYQDIGQVNAMASEAAHINRSQRGQFTKGNRTRDEYRDVMDNADSTQQTTAILIEHQAIVHIKDIVKTNILQYQTATTLTEPETSNKVTVDPVMLRESIIEFRMADGLLSKDRILDADQTMMAYQMMFQSQQANESYDLVAMLVNSLEQKGAKIKKFARQQPQLPPVQPGVPRPATQTGGAPGQ